MRSLVAILILAAVPSLAAADCPSARLTCLESIIALDTAVDRLGTTFVQVPESLYVSCDLARGESSMRLAFMVNEWVDLDLQDDYRIEGLPAGTPVDFVARLATTWNDIGSGTRRPFFGPELGAGPSGADTNRVVVSGPFSNPWFALLTLSLRRAAGEDFRLHVALNAANTSEGGHKINLTAKLSFEGLPPGASIVSCHGYHEGPVPAKPVSWGSVKARYR